MIPRLRIPLPAMAELDRRPWTGGLVIAPFDTRIGIRVEHFAQLDHVRQLLLPGWREESGEEVDFLWSMAGDGSVYYGNEQLGFDSYFHIYVGETALRRTFVHAGVVVCKGKALLLPGRSYVGKSTLTRELVEQGATFYSDDLAVLDEAGCVYPYPKPMSIRGANGRTEEIAAPGWSPALAGVPVALVAGLRYAGPEHKLVMEKVGGGQASFLLIENCLSIRREPVRDMRCISGLCTQAVCYQGQRGPAEVAAATLLQLLSAQPPGALTEI